MGKNQAYKAMQKARLGSSSAGPDEVEDGMMDGSFHSPEWHAARLASLKTSHTITWEEYKKKQKEDELKKGELEADKDRMMREYRAQLDAERESKLAHGRNRSSTKSNHKKNRKDKDSKKKSSRKRKDLKLGKMIGSAELCSGLYLLSCGLSSNQVSQASIQGESHLILALLITLHQRLLAVMKKKKLGDQNPDQKEQRRKGNTN